MTDEQAVLFPEYPAKTKTKAIFKPTKVQKAILDVLWTEDRPMDEWDLYYALEGEVRLQKVAEDLDELGKKGLIKDTGQRGQWTKQGRTIFWRALDGEL